MTERSWILWESMKHTGILVSSSPPAELRKPMLHLRNKFVCHHKTPQRIIPRELLKEKEREKKKVMNSLILLYNWDFKRCININRSRLLTKKETRVFIIVIANKFVCTILFEKKMSTLTFRVEFVCCQRLWNLQNQFSKSSLWY